MSWFIRIPLFLVAMALVAVCGFAAFIADGWSLGTALTTVSAEFFGIGLALYAIACD